MAWAVVLVVALAAFVILGEPTAGVTQVAPEEWAPAALVFGPVAAGCLLAAARRRGTTRAVLLAVVVALAYGVSDAMTLAVVHVLDDGVLAVLVSWQTYALAAVAGVGSWLQQLAYQAGHLVASLPTVIVGDPVVGVTLGVVVLGEHLRVSGAGWGGLVVAVAAMAAAVVALARSAARQRAPGPPGR